MLRSERKRLKQVRRDKKETMMKKKWKKLGKSRATAEFWQGIKAFRRGF